MLEEQKKTIASEHLQCRCQIQGQDLASGPICVLRKQIHCVYYIILAKWLCALHFGRKSVSKFKFVVIFNERCLFCFF